MAPHQRSICGRYLWGTTLLLLLSAVTSGCSENSDDLETLESLGAKVTRSASGQVTAISIIAPSDSARQHLGRLAGQLTELDELSLQGYEIDDEWLREIRELSKLRRLYLHKTSVTDAGLTHVNEIASLEVVSLCFCDLVTDDGVAELADLVNLQSLSLDFCSVISDESLSHLHSLDSLASLSIADTNVTDDGLRMLEGTTIQTLYAGGTKVTDDGLVHLRKLIQLRHLHLDNTGVTDAGLKDLGALIYLRGLDLNGNHITDDGLKSLQMMSSLRSLNVVSTEVTSEGIDRLRRNLDGDIVVQHGGLPFTAEADVEVESVQDQAIAASIKPATLAIAGRQSQHNVE
jgi:hypothetical protein